MFNKIPRTTIIIDDDAPKHRKDTMSVFEIMHKNTTVAAISLRGEVEIYNPTFMPYDLYLEEWDDFDTARNNVTEFQHWCASRMLSLDRTHAKAILNAIGALQSPTDADRANIALSCHCVSLTDVYWVRERGDHVAFEQINIYENSLNEAVVELSLKGRALTVTNQELVTPRDLAHDLSTRGLFPKAWIRRGNSFILLKDGGAETVRRELLASAICRCFDVPQVLYEPGEYGGERISQSRIVTSIDRSLVPMRAYEVRCINENLDYLEQVKKMDAAAYYGMNILDYLTGNTDRHMENWGLWVDNDTNEPISLHPLMDFNQCFGAYDTIDGANCLTVGGRRLSQRQAAIEAVQAIGLPQICEVDISVFGNNLEEADMFGKRLAELKRFAHDAQSNIDKSEENN